MLLLLLKVFYVRVLILQWLNDLAGQLCLSRVRKLFLFFKVEWLSSLLIQQAMQKSMHVSRAWPHEHLLAATVEYECKIRGAQRMA